MEGAGEIVDRSIEVGSERDVCDVGAGGEVGETDGVGVVVVKDEFGDVGGEGRGEGDFVEEDAFGSIHFEIDTSRPVECKLRYL